MLIESRERKQMTSQKDFERNASPYTADFEIVLDLEKQRIERTTSPEPSGCLDRKNVAA
jgi:hypothetical protein